MRTLTLALLLGAPVLAQVTPTLEIRERFESYSNTNFGTAPDTPGGYLMQRYMFGLNFDLDESVNVYTQVKSNLLDGRAGLPRPTDINHLDLHQAYLEARPEPGLRFRVGRQEMSFGSDRIISRREGPNSRLAFDALRVTLPAGDSTVDLIAARPVSSDVGIFDDHPDRGRYLWGVYSTVPLWEGAHTDLYYLGYQNTFVRFNGGRPADENRHSVGARLFGKDGHFDYNVEGVYQFGNWGGDPISAWTLASETGYTMGDFRLFLRTDVASGDGRLSDHRLGTFNALFPKGAYFGEIALIGPANLIDVHPGLEVQLSPTLTFTTDYDRFWRQSTQDGLYGPALNLLRASGDSLSRDVGQQWSQQLTWKVDPTTTLVFNYAHFAPGTFLRETGSARPVDFVATWVNFKL